MSQSISLALACVLALLATATSTAQTTATLQNRVDRLAEQIHLRHRHHEPSLEKHRGAVAAALAEWNRVSSLGDSPMNREQMTTWLDAAMRAVMPGGSGVMPAVPRFVEPRAPVTILSPITNTPPALPTETREVLPPQVSAPSRAIEPRVSSPRPAQQRVASSKVASGNLRSQFSAPRATGQRSAAKPIMPAIKPPASPAPRRSKWSRNPSAAPLEWRDPFVDDPAASPNPLRSGTRRKTQRPIAQPVRTVKVDLRQLAADIRGYNAAIRDLQSSVLSLPESDVFGLVEAAEELSRLEERRQFLGLYRSGLPVGKQALLPGSPSVELIRELVVRKATAMTRQAPPRQRAERRALEQLKERLARTGSADAGAF